MNQRFRKHLKSRECVAASVSDSESRTEIPGFTEPLEPGTLNTETAEPEVSEPETTKETVTSPVEKKADVQSDFSDTTAEVSDEAPVEDIQPEEESAALEQVKDSYEVISDDDQPVSEFKLDKTASSETIVLPNIKDQDQRKQLPAKSDDETVDILTADTIDLSTPITKVKQATEQLEPAADNTEEEQLEPVTEKKDVPTLDSLLNSMNTD